MSVLTLTLALQKGPPDHHLLRSVTFSLEGPTNERMTATRAGNTVSLSLAVLRATPPYRLLTAPQTAIIIMYDESTML